MRSLSIVPLLLLASAPLAAQTRAKRIKALKSITPAEIRRHVFSLASDGMKGRESGTAEAHIAAAYIAEHFRLAGLRPMGAEGGFFQPFTYDKQPNNQPRRGQLAHSNWLYTQPDLRKLKFETFRYDKEFRPLAGSGTGFHAGRLVFAGYGAVLPERQYDDWAGLDARGKVALILTGKPFEDGPEVSLQDKLAGARKRGVTAVILTDPRGGRKLPSTAAHRWPPQAPPGSGALPALLVTTTTADKLLKGLGKRVAALRTQITRTGKPASYPTGSRASYRWPMVRLRISVAGALVGGFKNVIGFKEGSDPKLKQEVVVVGGHYDHVGVGKFGSRRGRGKIHNGADDNASGTAGFLEIAQALHHVQLKRSVLVIAFDAEERGLIGSKHYVTAPVKPLKQTVAMFNMDMISRNGFNQIFIGAAKRNPTIYKILTDINRNYRITLRFDGMEKYTNRSDQYAFLEKGIPGIFFFGGIHPDYHTDADDPDKCNYSKARTITQLVFFVMYKVANLAKRP